MALNEHQADDGRGDSSNSNNNKTSSATANDHHRQQKQLSVCNKSNLETNNNNNNDSLTKSIPQVSPASGGATKSQQQAADTLQNCRPITTTGDDAPDETRKKLLGQQASELVEMPNGGGVSNENNNEQRTALEGDKSTEDNNRSPRHNKQQPNHTVIELANGDLKQPPHQKRTASADRDEAGKPQQQQENENSSNKSDTFATGTQSDAIDNPNLGDRNHDQQLGEDLALITTSNSKREEDEDVANLSAKLINQKIANGASPLNRNLQLHQQQQQQGGNDDDQLDPTECAKHTKARRVSFLQGLLLRKWPYLALTICIMSSLIFGMLLSALTVYTLHFWTDCNGLALAAANHHNQHHGDLRELAMALAGRPISAESNDDMSRAYPHPIASIESDALAGRGYLGVGGGAGEPPTGSGGNSTATLANDPNKPRFQRLPHTLLPEHYDLFIWPKISEPSFEFSGRVAIRLRCREATDNITLHALDLEIAEKAIKLEQVAGDGSAALGNSTAAAAANQQQAPRVKRLSQDKQMQYNIIHLDSQLQAGQNYLLTLDFTGNLNDDLAGFYKIKYERQNSSEPTWVAATQFEATDARRAFPCFDEPLFKATFSIQIKHWKNMTALSNMPIVHSEESKDGLWITDSFAKSQRMSTYLVAFAVTNFESRSEGNISVWTRPGFVHTAEYALKIAGKILRHYEDFFGIEYPLPKVDMIALPDFSAGAMENWGLITYRETAMLFDETTSSITNKQRVAVVVAHELAHQWFGNLVTPKWWDDLWLNEGFASFVEYIGVDHVEPKWQMLDQFVVDEVQNVFKLDGLSSSHQISIPVNNPEEITEIFDSISYGKGASVIRMMSHFLTEPVFKLGLQRYLRALKYSNAEQSDLWAHLTEAQRLLDTKTNSSSSSTSVMVSPPDVVNVEQVMNSWTLQTGYPLVTLNRSYGAAGKGATLEQVRYQPYKIIQNTNSSGSGNSTNVSPKPDAKQQKWEVPITYTWKSEQNWQPKTRLWLHQNVSKPTALNPADANKIDDAEWVLLNVNQVGYYRVNYDQRNWNLLIEQLKEDHKKISTTNRAQLMDDIFELAKSSVLDYKLPFEATKYLKKEQDYLPWESVLSAFSYIDEMLQRTPIYGQWKDHVADLIAPYYARYRDLEWTVGGEGQARGGSLKQQLLLAKSENSNSNKSTADSNNNSTKQPTGAVLSAMDSNDVLEQYNLINAVVWACQVDQHCIEKAKYYFKQWRETKVNRMNPAIRYTLYCTAIENGNKDDWDFLWKVYEKEQNASERDRILRALGCSNEIWILSRYLEWTFDKTKPIRRQDAGFAFRKIASNNYGRDIAFNFIRERWSTIKEYYGKSSSSLGQLVRSVCASMNTQTELDQLKGFYETIKGESIGKRSFQLAIEEIESNVFWRNQNYKVIENWLNKERSSKTSPSVMVN